MFTNTSDYVHRGWHPKLLGLLFIQILGFVYYIYFSKQNGYLPSPFIYDKSNTFMDLFNTMYWAYDDGRYSEWKSVYPPLNFLILKCLNYIFSEGKLGDPIYLRDSSRLTIYIFCLIYLAIPILVLSAKSWGKFHIYDKCLIYLIIILSTPMLFALERGNLIILAPAILAYMLSTKSTAKSISLATLINLKPYFAILTLPQLIKKDWQFFLKTASISAIIFIITGLALDNHFYLFFQNILSFTETESLFSLREVMSMPSSLSAITYVLKDPEGFSYASTHISTSLLTIVILLIESLKWLVIATAFLTLIKRWDLISDVETIFSLVVITSNLGIWVGGYSIILYMVFIPIFLGMKYKKLYITALIALALPLDIIPLIEADIGLQYSFIADALINVNWTLGLGSLLRPCINITLLLTITIEFYYRKQASNLNLSKPNL